MTLTDRIASFAATHNLVHETAGGLFDGPAAVYDQARVYRYLLLRQWGSGPVIVWVMLNPSTATAEVDDPTITRVTRRSARLGYGAALIMNLFAYRATDPVVMLCAEDPAGPANNATLIEFAAPGTTVVAAWGAHGFHRGRAAAVTAMLAAAGVELCCLKVTKAGEPWHPLYIPMSSPLIPYVRKAVSAA